MRHHKSSLTLPAGQIIRAGALVLIKARCAEIESGGCMFDAILTDTPLPELSRQFLNKTLEGRVLSRVTVGPGDEMFTYGFVEKLGSMV